MQKKKRMGKKDVMFFLPIFFLYASFFYEVFTFTM
ncbi:hypothetical protein PPE_05495 [Paenibacillus polymyxa E681]|nr:hypothetical protein PPE_05495 [Paenibacillus polymyxa E681]